jgi:hypothetical protein
MFLQFSDKRKRPAMQLSMQNTNTFPLGYENILSRTSSESQPAINPEPEEPKVINRWGQPTWLLLHTLAEKVREESFPIIRKELLNNILSICTNLPCPTCASHAVDYLNNIKLNTIVTKQNLKDMLYKFHNKVNEDKKYEQFDYNELDSKYSTAITNNVIHNFMYYYGQKYITNRLSADGFHRKLVMQNLSLWFQTNMHHFLP